MTHGTPADCFCRAKIPTPPCFISVRINLNFKRSTFQRAYMKQSVSEVSRKHSLVFLQFPKKAEKPPEMLQKFGIFFISV